MTEDNFELVLRQIRQTLIDVKQHRQNFCVCDMQ